jgi:hypothetical protein
MATVKATAAILAAILIAAPLAFPGSVRAGDSVAAAEALARTTYFEGVPYGEGRNLGEAGVARLIEMLDDPDEAPHRAQIIELLGISGRAGAYEAVAAAAAGAPTGEVDGATYRTRVAALVALGHLAHGDDRALADLIAAATADAAPPTWSHRHLRGPRLAALLRRSAAMALGVSGRPQAEAVLRRLQRDARGAPELERHLDAALLLRARVASEGAAAVFGGDRFGGGRQ